MGWNRGKGGTPDSARLFGRFHGRLYFKIPMSCCESFCLKEIKEVEYYFYDYSINFRSVISAFSEL